MIREGQTLRPETGRPALIQAVIDAMRVPDLRYRILFTLGILIIFRFFAHVPVPGVDRDALAAAFDANPLLGFLDLFSGGALRNLSIAALGVYPYITASIIMQVLTPVVPALKELSKEGEYGRQKINQWTHYLTVPIAFLQGFAQLNLMQGAFGGALVVGAGATIRLTNCTLTENFAAGIGGAISASGYAELYNCISWGNIPNELNHGALVQFTDIAGGYQGEGNIDSDPLFRQYRGFPYVLSAASPCIDAGDPALEDGISDWHPRWPHGHPNDTRSDMGAYGGPGNVAWIEH